MIYSIAIAHQLNHHRVTSAKTTFNGLQSARVLLILLDAALLLHYSYDTSSCYLSAKLSSIYPSFRPNLCLYFLTGPLGLLFLYNNSKIQKMNSQNNYDLLFKYIVVGDTSNCVV